MGRVGGLLPLLGTDFVLLGSAVEVFQDTVKTVSVGAEVVAVDVEEVYVEAAGERGKRVEEESAVDKATIEVETIPGDENVGLGVEVGETKEEVLLAIEAVCVDRVDLSFAFVSEAMTGAKEMSVRTVESRGFDVPHAGSQGLASFLLPAVGLVSCFPGDADFLGRFGVDSYNNLLLFGFARHGDSGLEEKEEEEEETGGPGTAGFVAATEGRHRNQGEHGTSPCEVKHRKSWGPKSTGLDQGPHPASLQARISYRRASPGCQQLSPGWGQ